jgi:FkbM family methyltransferase
VTSNNHPLEGPIPLFDVCTVLILKFSFISLRLFFRLLLGRQRRDKIYFLRRFWLDSRLDSPSYLLIARLYSLLNRNVFPLLKIQVPRYHYQYFCRIEKGDFTPGHEDHILARFIPKEGDTVIDIGAHIGRYTISSKMVGKTGKVVAIEADLDTFQILKRNVALNNLTNVLPLNIAVFSTKTRIKLYEQSASAKYNSIMLTRAAKTKNYVELNADALDSILKLNGVNQVNWIKIDVEGAEFEVLKGSTKTLSSENISLLIEIHNNDDPSHYDNIVDFLKHDKYEITFEQRYEGSGESHVIFRKKNKDKDNSRNL